MTTITDCKIHSIKNGAMSVPRTCQGCVTFGKCRYYETQANGESEPILKEEYRDKPKRPKVLIDKKLTFSMPYSDGGSDARIEATFDGNDDSIVLIQGSDDLHLTVEDAEWLRAVLDHIEDFKTRY